MFFTRALEYKGIELLHSEWVSFIPNVESCEIRAR